ncbi:hypothetical protein BCR34DRAFT_475643 [Clohesyomyces aquaticus]|uniref:Glycosyltransferase family 31 protein n=1 Tax=Clohesyomyces aquaticus TaxID=1231657 RepID=A0A1Y2A310_9PLEO|nr:hypothetical protein BCR34DRAFT_475643 [Clohesyomyces aquaticus]
MLSTGAPRLRLIPRLLVLVAAFYALIWVSGFPREYDDEELPPNRRHKTSMLEQPFPVEHNQVVVSVKTTAMDAYTAVPPRLVLTKTEYYDTLIVMGDLAMEIGAFHVEDVLGRFDNKVMQHNPDFERYRKQLAFARSRRKLEWLREADAHKEAEIRSKLDKYKWLRMVGRAWELRPDRVWYVFADIDTYLVRPNLLAWLGQYDAEKPYFFANPPDMTSDAPFGFGGTMFVLSVAAMRELLRERKSVVPDWDSRISDYASGFEVLTSALSTEINLTVSGSISGISGMHPGTIPYSPSLWCEHVIAMHNVPAELASDIWRLEREREEWQHSRDPLTFAVLWKNFIQPEDMLNPRSDWDNLSSGPENAKWNILFESASQTKHFHQHTPHGGATRGEDSWEACRDSCISNVHCVQYSYSSIPTPNYNDNGPTKCHLSSTMRLGAVVDPRIVEVDGKQETLSWKSGWVKDKFERWAQHERCKGQQN